MSQKVEITDFSAPELDIYARLTEAQLLNRDRPEEGLFIAESPKVILRALDAGYEPVSILMAHDDWERETEEILARCSKIPLYTAEFSVLTQLTGVQLTRGMLCAMRRKPLPAAEEICRGASRIAVLENIMNPTNVGAIFRSAAALGMDAVLLTPGCSNPLYRRAIRVSMGTVFQIPWTFLNDSDRSGDMKTDDKSPESGTERFRSAGLPGRLRSLGFRSAAMALSDQSLSIDDPRLASVERLAIVLGTEGDGLTAKTIEGCDYTVKIPMAHGVDSLNVAAASAVAFWQLSEKL